MRFYRFGTAVILIGGLLTLFILGLGGCASPPHERPDRDKIKQDSEKSFQDLEREENKTREGY